MTYNQQHTGCSDPGGASGFSPASISLQQTRGEILFVCLCWGFTAQSSRGHVEPVS